jgi:hypothetical protein
MKAAELKAEIIAWIENEGPNAPPSFVEIATRLSTDENLSPAWRELAKRDIHGMCVAKMAWGSYLEASTMMRRHPLPSEDECNRQQAVENYAQKLIDAIDKAPLFDTAHIIQLGGKSTAFAWRADGKRQAQTLYPSKQIIELRELLEYTVTFAANLRQGKQTREVKRWRKDPEAAFFVRDLAIKLEKACGQKLMGTIALIASAALDRGGNNPITKQQVQSILRG